MGSPLASLSATRGFRVKVEPSLRVPVYGRPEAADGASEAAADAAPTRGGWALRPTARRSAPSMRRLSYRLRGAA